MTPAAAGAQLAVVSSSPSVEIAPAVPCARRNVNYVYPASERGKVSITGDVLDGVMGDVAVSKAWRGLPSCASCWRPETLRMVPEYARRCATHGKPTLPFPDPYELAGAERAAAERDAWTKLAPKLGIPFKYRSWSFGTAQPTPALIAAAKAALADDDDTDDYLCNGVILEGAPGCGKTVALTCAVRELAVWGSGDVTVFYSFPDLSRALLDPARRDEAFEQCREADTLLIDDVGCGYVKPDGAVVRLFEEIVVHREANSYQLIASTNLDSKRFRAMFGARVYDRLKGEWGRWINVDRPSLRRKRDRSGA